MAKQSEALTLIEHSPFSGHISVPMQISQNGTQIHHSKYESVSIASYIIYAAFVLTIALMHCNSHALSLVICQLQFLILGIHKSIA